jgi:hypothetical protein
LLKKTSVPLAKISLNDYYSIGQYKSPLTPAVRLMVRQAHHDHPEPIEWSQRSPLIRRERIKDEGKIFLLATF